MICKRNQISFFLYDRHCISHSNNPIYILFLILIILFIYLFIYILTYYSDIVLHSDFFYIVLHIIFCFHLFFSFIFVFFHVIYVFLSDVVFDIVELLLTVLLWYLDERFGGSVSWLKETHVFLVHWSSVPWLLTGVLGNIGSVCVSLHEVHLPLTAHSSGRSSQRGLLWAEIDWWKYVS